MVFVGNPFVKIDFVSLKIFLNVIRAVLPFKDGFLLPAFTFFFFSILCMKSCSSLVACP